MSIIKIVYQNNVWILEVNSPNSVIFLFSYNYCKINNIKCTHGLIIKK